MPTLPSGRAFALSMGHIIEPVDFHSNHGHPQSAGLHLPEGACFMSTMRLLYL